MKHETRTMHLFAGHGGGLLADLILGHTPVVAVEWDAYACQILRERAADGWFPGLRVWEGDVRLFDPSEYTGSVDIIHAGFPCQDISNAGTKAGVGPETRSGLYREVLRIAGVVRPKQLFLENVSAIVSGGLETVLADLIALGYDSEWLCIRASDCGAAHHRDRWFALCTNANNARLQGWEKTQGEGREDSDGYGREICATFPNPQSRPGQKQEPQSLRKGGQIREAWALQPRDKNCDIGQLSNWWTTESDVGRVANGIPHRVHRLKGLGNAQVPLQAAAAYRLLGGM